MVTFIVAGRRRQVVLAVLQAIRGFIDAKCIVIGGEELRPLRWSPLCQGQIFIRFDGSDDDHFVTAVTAFSRRTQRVILIPADSDAIRLANRVRTRLSLRITPIPDMTMLETFDDLRAFHHFCRSHALSVPQTCFIERNSTLDFDAIAAILGAPFVVRPVAGAGSPGPTIVASKKRLAQAVDAHHACGNVSLLAQRHIDGKDIGLSLLSVRGRICAIAIQQWNGSRIDFVPNPYLEHTAKMLCRTTSYHGVMHLSARMEKSTGEVFLTSAHPEFWPSLTAAAWCGLNFVAAAVMPPGEASGVRRLTAGTSSIRNPVMRPSSWARLLTDATERGRLLRAETFDLHALGSITRKIPMKLWGRARSRGDSLGVKYPG